MIPPTPTRPTVLRLASALVLGLVLLPDTAWTEQQEPKPVRDGYHEFNYGNVQEGAADWVLAIQVQEPAPRSEVRGDVTVRFRAKGMQWATAWCWQQPEDPALTPPMAWGTDVELTPGGITLAADGSGTFVFPADQFPNGPVSVRIHTRHDDGKKDLYELQLFNLGGVVWNQGIPTSDPPGAQGLQLVYADDFDGPMSITSDGRGARYGAHKPGGGDFSGWQFSDVLGPGKPFAHHGTWLRIAARKDAESPQGRSGLIVTVDADFKGTWAKPPFYAECRFTAQSAIGTWPAFWSMAYGPEGTDELDIIEAYGGRGRGNPNHPGYSIVSHFWGQKNADGSKRKSFSARPLIMELGGGSYWSTTFHTYAVRVNLDDTIFYFDDIEVHRHPTNVVSRVNPHLLLVNYAIGGISGWPTNLTRYGEGTDMWVDYLRVYAEETVPEDYRPHFVPQADLRTPAIGLNFTVSGADTTVIDPAGDPAGASGVRHQRWNNLEGGVGEAAELRDATGATVPGLRATWTGLGADPQAASQLGREWGFQFADLRLQRGLLLEGGRLEVSGVPYPRYDVYVYFGAQDHGGTGSATISSTTGTVDPQATYFYKIGWSGGTFVPSAATTREKVKASNYVVFTGNAASSFQVEWAGNVAGAATGVTAVQIVARP